MRFNIVRVNGKFVTIEDLQDFERKLYSSDNENLRETFKDWKEDLYSVKSGLIIDSLNRLFKNNKPLYCDESGLIPYYINRLSKNNKCLYILNENTLRYAIKYLRKSLMTYKGTKMIINDAGLKWFPKGVERRVIKHFRETFKSEVLFNLEKILDSTCFSDQTLVCIIYRF